VLAPAEPAELNLDLAGWYRRGGRRCTVHVTAKEFAAAVQGGLIEQFGPWRLTGSDASVGAGGGRVENPWVADEVAFDRYGHEPSGAPRVNMWVWSPALTRSHPPLSVGREYESICSLNGFLLIQHATSPMYSAVPRRATTRDVCVVDAVYTNSGELVTRPHYLNVWRRGPGQRSPGRAGWTGHPTRAVRRASGSHADRPGCCRAAAGPGATGATGCPARPVRAGRSSLARRRR
jgi:hypothetical protein